MNGQALEELTAEEAMNGLLSGNSDGTGEPLLNLERNIVNVCFTNNDNDLTTGDFRGGAQSSGKQSANTDNDVNTVATPP